MPYTVTLLCALAPKLAASKDNAVALPALEELYAALADIVVLPVTSALNGQLAAPWAFWGGKPLTGFLRAPGAGAGAASGNVTLSGLPLAPGRLYALALRASARKNSSSAFV